MRTLRLLGLVAAVWILAAVVSPWVAAGLGAAGGWRFAFARVYDRVFELLLVAAVLFAWRRLDLGNARQLGLARPRWAAELGRGLGVGFAGVGVALLVCMVAGALVRLDLGWTRRVGVADASLRTMGLREQPLVLDSRPLVERGLVTEDQLLQALADSDKTVVIWSYVALLMIDQEVSEQHVLGIASLLKPKNKPLVRIHAMAEPARCKGIRWLVRAK